MKLEIKHLAPYLPYGLRVTKDDWNNSLELGIHPQGNFSSNSVDCQYVLRVKAKPLLHPLSKLTEEIDHNGETFIPAERLCAYGAEGMLDINHEAAYKGKYTIEKSSDEFELTNILVKPTDNKYSWLHITVGDDDVSFDVYFRTVNGNVRGAVLNQKMLFDKLHEWHFDLYNLLDNGLAKEK